MAWKVVFSARSREDLRQIAEYVSRDKPAVADRFVSDLISHAEGIALAPRMGVRYERDAVARYIVYRPYLIIYDIDEDRCEIVIRRFWHGARGIRPK